MACDNCNVEIDEAIVINGYNSCQSCKELYDEIISSPIFTE
tara:strand:+ start:92 stop:214 length:123 start_codon:yes stop_codon:yes gene_type:complete